ncbi:MAG: nitrilase/cyanide hydratase and apolipoprotein N-acyltransferase [Symbiobacteriaceae bacterium]|jgi:predicted amidohydrolase|nr:nitrilase/cyanide hydratase and apolipoprotein N-acyltransferase [Symbiobacteriaceae bacterium]
MRVIVAAVQYEPSFGDKAHNLTALRDLTAQAARAGARLVVLPEMATTGYCFADRAEIAPLVEPIPDGPTVRAFAELAAAQGIYIVVGMPEVEPATGAFYNTAALVGPQGYIGKYRKTHSFIDETRWARDGDLGIPVFATDLGRIGIVICMDNSFFEPARVAALAGADLLAFPTNWLGNQDAWRARALENGVYVISANRWGEERGTKFCGNSAVIDPNGRDIGLLATGNGLVLAEVETDLARAARTVALARRRPEQYQELLISSYLWHWREARRLPAGRPAVVAAGDATEPGRMADQVRWADKRARDRGWPKLDLAVFPWCDDAPDPGALAELARTLDCYLVWGAPEEGGYSTAWLAGPSGIAHRYRQVHAARGGDGFAVIDLPWGRLGLLLDADLLVPEAARILAKRGADLIAAPSRPAEALERLVHKERALENDTALVVAEAGAGGAVYQPMRPRITRAEVPGEMALALVDTGAEAVRAKELLRKLQPRWYDPLVKQ